jgi:aspartate/methionine/tyrosine aminotransferase
VVVTPGGKPVMFFLILALLQEGDEAIYPDPGFPIYGSMINFTGAKPVPIALREENSFELDVDELESLITPRTKLLIINTPANPTVACSAPKAPAHCRTGGRARPDRDVRRDLRRTDLRRRARLHRHLPRHEGAHVILDGFSKTYAMTGWRLGYGIFPPELVPAISRLGVNSVSCTSVSTQRAGIAALTGPQDKVIEFREAFRTRRDLIVSGLNAIDGISCVMPKGAFYAFPNITGTGLSSREFADKLLEEYGVAGIAGTSFGAAGEGYLRLSTANSEANLQKALDRVATMVADLKG